ncbi:beta-microseminoprotein [Choloepus didactylus]|uniref:beta-microseminoprotein n=1 Tax=Choloepus didactylus TaxID=27675 RepID=UPI00189EBFC0|nr:beta-microseminoprotein [Choloepus didactylus]
MGGHSGGRGAEVVHAIADIPLEPTILCTVNLNQSSLLGSLLVFITFVSLGNAYCFLKCNVYTPGNSPVECKGPLGVPHQLNSEWKSEGCEWCICREDGISCCIFVPKPVGFDTDNCKTILNRKTCNYTVVEKKDPRKICLF